MSVLDQGGSCQDAAVADAASKVRSASELKVVGDRAVTFRRHLVQK